MQFQHILSLSTWTMCRNGIATAWAAIWIWNGLSIFGIAEEDWRPMEPKSPAVWFGQTIRESAWRSPQEELAGFHVPKGFVVELVASEPDIAKPMNLAFDTQGRLWMTQSVLYPFPAKDGSSPGDAVMVLEDRDKDGSFETKRRPPL
jgi:hypothetical protein